MKKGKKGLLPPTEQDSILVSIENPKGFTYIAIYEPDREKMISACKILLNSGKSTKGTL